MITVATPRPALDEGRCNACGHRRTDTNGIRLPLSDDDTSIKVSLVINSGIAESFRLCPSCAEELVAKLVVAIEALA